MSLITISQANCKNCYKCVRYCPVKAIKIKDGQAEVIEERCISCGICVNICPQKAKVIRSDIDKVKGFIKEGHTVVASIAPSFLSVVANPEDFIARLHGLGLHEIRETAEGAELVSRQYPRIIKELPSKPVISTACPVIINLVERYYPKLLSHLAPLVSPMVAHGRYIKETKGNKVKVVFIGPCIAKKQEAEDDEVRGAVDSVLTFRELKEWIQEDKISNSYSRTEGMFDPEPENARYFALPGGLLRTSKIDGDLDNIKTVVVDGIDECKQVMDAIEKRGLDAEFFELLACRGGCIGGPAAGIEENPFVKRERYLKQIELISSKINIFNPGTDTGIELTRGFHSKVFIKHYPGERKIREILSSIGKTSEDKELNCGSCGYPSCRDKAVAVYQGMAEPDMCMPYMRSKAESLANLIIDSTPNGIILTNAKLRIQEFNPSAERMFKINRNQVIGKELGTLIDDSDFLNVFMSRKSIIDRRVKYERFNLVTLQTICYIHEQDLVLGIFTDITRQEGREKELAEVRRETIEKAREVINKQMRVAQEIAGLLGETTAESKVLLTRLINLVKGGGETDEGIC
ncbi:Periplasmic [Fe] hydrogenase large subunit [Koleobacter methoxysyntrophicus]|uniref:Periplasmic [Fe] hydrogenase large subunit n=1 Tax=Koleobacter methoxysyntrophicus TaxID=2751313 RepID=A0A8A0RJK1_9FIRM|nr:[Fe-Fe] hydrogenase large subunit C-terminal domain-containing protein [Koleobacter methoxysyntrophicus]QSQ07820.1 Periplasmic [Fe] hydrogenase large subunit [Koleobacter methoxysyntrophicus]